jgi:hypothetical protein
MDLTYVFSDTQIHGLGKDAEVGSVVTIKDQGSYLIVKICESHHEAARCHEA